jgi:serine protease Do
MKRLCLALALVIGACSTPQRFTRVARNAMPAVVKIESSFIDKGELHTAIGTGVVITKKGHILTCAHVVNNSVFLYVTFNNSSRVIPGRVMLRDNKRDLALIKINQNSSDFIRLAPEMPAVGDEVVAIGHPLNFGWSVTSGIVSALEREGLAINLLQTDTAINPGNSGGPLLNLDGKLVGVNQSIIVGANSMGFAVPVSEIKQFLSVFEGL